jgi:hypothetical protein
MNLSLFQQNIEKQLDAGCSHPEGDSRATAVSNCCTGLQAPVTRPSAVHFIGWPTQFASVHRAVSLSRTALLVCKHQSHVRPLCTSSADQHSLRWSIVRCRCLELLLTCQSHARPL